MRTSATTADAYRLIHDGVSALSRAEQHGICIDTSYCAKMRDHLTRRAARLEARLQRTKLYRRWEHMYKGKTNIHSNHQLSRLLYGAMKIKPPKETNSGQGSTDEDSLSRIDLPELKLIIQIRKLTKVRDTYLEAFLREQHDGRIHPCFLLHTVRTYRSSCADPNLQNIPKRDDESMRICRRALLPSPGHQFIEMDFASIEVHIAGLYSQDPALIKYLRDRKSDMHSDMAKQLFMLEDLDRTLPAHNTLRQAAKNGFVFPQFYGDYYVNNAAALVDWARLPQGTWSPGVGLTLPSGEHISDHFRRRGIRSYQGFVKHVEATQDDFWNKRFRVYNSWRRHRVEQYRRQGRLRMLTGFECSGVMTRNEILNYPIQGTAFHCLLFTFIKLDEAMRAEGWESRLVGQIHDSIVLDAHPKEVAHIEETARRIVREDMPLAWDWITVPLQIDVETYNVDSPWVKR